MSVRTELWTDGSGIATGGPGGWACVLLAMDAETGDVLKRVEGSGGIPWCTNQQAEMTAVIEGLLLLRNPTALTVVTDSQYVMHGFTKGWVARWQRNGWRTREDEPVQNADLWMALADAATIHSLGFRHVKGHQGGRRCACGWEGSRRNRKCPPCGEATELYDTYPENARCDVLAGLERRKLLEVAA